MSSQSAERAVSESTTALIDTVERFWPAGPAQIVRRSAQCEFGFAFVPDAARPRLLVPVAGGRVASEAMQKYSASLSSREILKRAGVSAFFRVFGVWPLRDRLIYAPGADSLQNYLNKVLGESVHFTISVGTARANRKPILQVFSAQGRTLAYAKIGDGEVSASDVSREMRSLDAIQGRLPGQFEVPERLHFGTWEGMKVLVLSPLKVAALQRPLRWLKVPSSEMTALSRAFEESPVVVGDTSGWHRGGELIAQLSSTNRRERLLALRQSVAALGDRLPLKVGAWHGDWTPWNMAWTGGRLQLWDWERFETGVPEGFDGYHFWVNVVTRRVGFTRAGIQQALVRAADPGKSVRESNLVAAAYLLTLGTRYAASAEGPTGALIADRADTVIGAAEEWLTRVGTIKES